MEFRLGSWKVMEFRLGSWKVMEFRLGSWKVMEFPLGSSSSLSFSSLPSPPVLLLLLFALLFFRFPLLHFLLFPLLPPRLTHVGAIVLKQKHNWTSQQKNGTAFFFEE